MSKMLRLTFLLACFLTLWTTSVTAQGSDAVLKVQNEPLPQVLRQLELKTDYRFLYINDDLKGYTFSGDLTLKDINSTMTQLLAGKPLGYTVNQQYITITCVMIAVVVIAFSVFFSLIVISFLYFCNKNDSTLK